MLDEIHCNITKTVLAAAKNNLRDSQSFQVTTNKNLHFHFVPSIHSSFAIHFSFHPVKLQPLFVS